MCLADVRFPALAENLLSTLCGHRDLGFTSHMTMFDTALLLSAQRALLGAVDADVRMIGVKRDGQTITLTTVSAHPLGDIAAEALSIAATEIIADFPDCQIDECFVVSGDEPWSKRGVGAIVFQRLEVA